MDPHTSVAQIVANRYIKKENISRPVIISATAHFSKFAKDIYTALSLENKISDEFEMLKQIQKNYPDLYIPISISSLKKKRIIFQEKCDKSKSTVEDNIIKLIIND